MRFLSGGDAGDSAAAAIRALAAAMRALEAGPGVLVPIPARTLRGFARATCWKPAAAIVFYTLPPGVSIEQLIRRTVAVLEEVGPPAGASAPGAGTGPYDHLLDADLAAAATGASVLRLRGRDRLLPLTHVTGPRPCFQHAIEVPAGRRIPARVVVHTGLYSSWLPPAHSVRGGFTWCFMPAPAVRALEGTIGTDTARLNAVVASLFFDGGGLLPALPAEPLFDTVAILARAAWPRRRVDLSDPLGPALAWLRTPREVFGGSPMQGGTDAVLVVKDDGTLELAGTYLHLTAPMFGRVASTLPTGGLNAPQALECFACGVPLGEWAVVADGLTAPSSANRRKHGVKTDDEWQWRGWKTPRRVVLCVGCADWFGRDQCVYEHMGGRMARVRTGRCQADSCHELANQHDMFAVPQLSGIKPGSCGVNIFESLALLLRMRARPTGTPGAFLLEDVDVDSVPARPRVLLTGELYGPWPEAIRSELWAVANAYGGEPLPIATCRLAVEVSPPGVLRGTSAPV